MKSSTLLTEQSPKISEIHEIENLKLLIALSDEAKSESWDITNKWLFIFLHVMSKKHSSM